MTVNEVVQDMTAQEKALVEGRLRTVRCGADAALGKWILAGQSTLSPNKSGPCPSLQQRCSALPELPGQGALSLSPQAIRPAGEQDCGATQIGRRGLASTCRPSNT